MASAPGCPSRSGGARTSASSRGGIGIFLAERFAGWARQDGDGSGMSAESGHRHYTIGQRGACRPGGGILYVLAIEPAENLVVVGRGGPLSSGGWRPER